MLTLPKRVLTTTLLSFWTVVSFILTAGLTVTGFLLTKSYLSLICLALFPLLVIPAYRNPEFIRYFYVPCNHILHRIANTLKGWVLNLTYALGYADFIRREKHDRQSDETLSTWADPAENVNQINKDVFEANSARSVFTWIIDSKRWDMFSLLPMIFFIQMIGTKSSIRKADSTYTLY